MKLDGATFIDRVEVIEMVNDGLHNKGHTQGQHIKSVQLSYLKWSLGELLFDRQVVNKVFSRS